MFNEKYKTQTVNDLINAIIPINKLFAMRLTKQKDCITPGNKQ